jgi:hypothetical protein
MRLRGLSAATLVVRSREVNHNLLGWVATLCSGHIEWRAREAVVIALDPE